VIPIMRGRARTAVRLLIQRDAFDEARSRGLARMVLLENTRAQEPGNELKLVRRQTRQKPPGFHLKALICTRYQSGYKSISHYRVSCRKQTMTVLIGIIAKSRSPRKGGGGWNR
jgi:hypothetical protein